MAQFEVGGLRAVTLLASGATSTLNNVDCGSGNNRIMVVNIGGRNNVGYSIPDGGITVGGQVMTPAAAGAFQGQCYGRWFYLLNPPSGLQDVVIDPSTSAGDMAAVFEYMVFEDAAQQAPTGMTSGGNTFATDPSPELAVSSQVGDVAFWMVLERGPLVDGAHTPSGYTEVFDGQNSEAAGTGGYADGAATVNFSATQNHTSAIDWLAVGGSIEDIGGGGGGNTQPDTPTCTVDDQTHNSVDLSSSAFADDDVGDTHEASQWQVDEAGGDFSSPVADSGEDTVNLTSRTFGGLTPSTNYIARVRHKDDSGDSGTEWSEWSTSASFTTDAAPVGNNLLLLRRRRSG